MNLLPFALLTLWVSMSKVEHDKELEEQTACRCFSGHKGEHLEISDHNSIRSLIETAFKPSPVQEDTYQSYGNNCSISNNLPLFFCSVACETKKKIWLLISLFSFDQYWIYYQFRGIIGFLKANQNVGRMTSISGGSS